MFLVSGFPRLRAMWFALVPKLVWARAQGADMFRSECSRLSGALPLSVILSLRRTSEAVAHGTSGGRCISGEPNSAFPQQRHFRCRKRSQVLRFAQNELGGTRHVARAFRGQRNRTA